MRTIFTPYSPFAKRLNWQRRARQWVSLILLSLITSLTLMSCTDSDDDDDDLDLSVIDAQLSSSNGEYIINTLYNLTFRIRNDGDFDLVDVPFEVRVNGAEIASGQVNVSSDDTTVEQRVSLSLSSASSSTAISIVVDPDDIYNEDQEGNNTVSFVIEVLSEATPSTNS